MLGSLHLIYEELGTYKDLIQGKGKKIGSEDGGTNCDFSLTAGVLAGADVTGDGSQRFSFQLLHIVDSSAVLSHLPEKGSGYFEILWGNIGSEIQVPC